MTGQFKLDRLDISILAQLQRNGRITNKALADAVGLSPSPCLQRVRRLEKAGYVADYRAHVRLDKIVDFTTVFTEVTLSDHRKEDFIKFEAEIRNHKAVQECHLVSGGYDYLLKFVSRDVSHYQELIEGLLELRIGIDKYFSYVVLKSVLVRDFIAIDAIQPIHEDE